MPIIYYSIDSALKSNLFIKIHISTDDIKIKKIVEKKGVKIDFMRPKKLSRDLTPLIDVFQYVVDEYSKKGFNYDEIWSLMPCSPLIDYKDLIKISRFCGKIKKPVLSLSKYKVPIQWAYKIDKKMK